MAYPDLITLDQLKGESHIDFNDDDERLGRICNDAQAIVIDYVKKASDAYDTTLPLHVRRAMIVVAQNLIEAPMEDPISDAVKSLLMRERSPALA